MHLISQDLPLKPPVGLPPVMSPSLWILTLLLFTHLPAAPLVGASAPFPPPRRLLSNETAASLTSAAPTIPPPPDFCSTSTTCNSRIFPHSRTLTIAVVAIFVACVVMAFVSVYARRFCIQEGNLGTNYYSMEMCGGYAGNDALVKSLPVVKYEAGEDESKKMKECAVCLSEFERGEMLRLLPACEHLFHKDCIDMWLFSHTTCPLCRVSLLKHRRGSQSSGAPHQISEAVDLQPILSSHHAPLVTTAAG